MFFFWGGGKARGGGEKNKCTIPPADSFRGRVDVTAKVRRSSNSEAGEEEEAVVTMLLLGRMATAGRRKSLEAIFCFVLFSSWEEEKLPIDEFVVFLVIQLRIDLGGEREEGEKEWEDENRGGTQVGQGRVVSLQS